MLSPPLVESSVCMYEDILKAAPSNGATRVFKFQKMPHSLHNLLY
jgi:hypothetical protein